MLKTRNLFYMVLFILCILALSTTSVSALVTSYVTYDADAETYYEYEYVGLASSYSDWQLSQDTPSANLYKHFIPNAVNVVALRNTQNQYVNYEKVAVASSNAQLASEPFDANDYVETADLYENLPSSLTRVELDESNNIIETIIPLIDKPTATAAKLIDSGSNEVAAIESNGTLTFLVDPDAEYVNASVIMSEQVHVRILDESATVIRDWALVDAGELTGNVAMQTLFNVTGTRTGAALIAQSPLTVQLSTDEGVTVHNTYTVVVEEDTTVGPTEFRVLDIY